jgi:hypothetical protein
MLTPVGFTRDRVEDRDSEKRGRRRPRKQEKKVKEVAALSLDARGDQLDFRA